MLEFLKETERPHDEQILEHMMEKEFHPDWMPVIKNMAHYPGIDQFYSGLTADTNWSGSVLLTTKE